MLININDLNLERYRGLHSVAKQQISRSLYVKMASQLLHQFFLIKVITPPPRLAKLACLSRRKQLKPSIFTSSKSISECNQVSWNIATPHRLLRGDDKSKRTSEYLDQNERMLEDKMMGKHIRERSFRRRRATCHDLLHVALVY